MHEALTVLAIVLTVGVVAGAARRFDLPAPLVLVLVGMLGSFLPFVPEVELSPELVLAGFLPPLLYAASIRTSLVDFRAERRPIGLLAVGLVIVSALAVGAVVHALVPGVPFAAAVALGAVVAPPDAVSATAVARRVGMPRRIVTVLEGESLLNDATALVLLRTSLAALGATTVVTDVVVDFFWAAGGGAAIGFVVFVVLAAARRRLEDPVLDTTLSFTAPFVSYFAAEEAGTSGVLAVVVTGLALGHKAPVLQTAASRVNERTNWTTVQFLLENAVFLLIGLQALPVLQDAASDDLGVPALVGVCAAVIATLLVARPLWIFLIALLPYSLVGRGGSRGSHGGDTGRPSSAVLAVLSWAGMRGVVTLAAALSLPADTPRRSVLVLIALVVVVVTLLLQGSTLPWLVRRLGLRPADPAQDALARASLLQEATNAGLTRLDEVLAQAPAPGEPSEVVDRLRRRTRDRSDAAWERLGRDESELETPSQTYRRLRLAMLLAEREVVLMRRDEGLVPADVLASVLEQLDVEETVLDRSTERLARLPRGSGVVGVTAGGSGSQTESGSSVDATPTPAAGAAGSVSDGCEDLAAHPLPPVLEVAHSCPDCVTAGVRSWVHLRRCLACGHVGCCDSSPLRHADTHARDAGHPVMASAEPGERWRWCYPHELLHAEAPAP